MMGPTAGTAVMRGGTLVPESTAVVAAFLENKLDPHADGSHTSSAMVEIRSSVSGCPLHGFILDTDRSLKLQQTPPK